MIKKILGLLIFIMIVSITALPSMGSINSGNDEDFNQKTTTDLPKHTEQDLCNIPSFDKNDFGQMSMNYQDKRQISMDDYQESFDVDWWPMFGHDLANSGYSSSNVPETNNLLWSVKTNIGSESSPIIVDGRVYITTGIWWSGQLHCIDLLTGDFLWNYTAEDSIYSSPAVIDDNLFIVTRGGKMLCFNSSNGIKKWDASLGTNNNIVTCFGESPAIYNGRIYIACSGDPNSQDNKGGLFCLNASNGDILWSFNTENSTGYSPACSDGKIYATGLNNNLYCFNASNGDVIWISPDFQIRSAPVIISNRVYVKTSEDTVICVENGLCIWEFQPQVGYLVFSSIVGNDNSIYFSTNHPNVNILAKIHKLDAETGDEQWSYTTTSHRKFWGTPTLTENHLFIIEQYTYDQTHTTSIVCCFNSSTKEKVWSYSLPENFNSYILGSLSIANGLLVISSVEYDYTDGWGGIYCFGDASPPVANANGPYDAIIGENIQFNGSVTGGKPPYKDYLWDFGDGDLAFAQNSEHSYTEAGEYTVIFWVTDDNGNWDNDTTTVTISEPVPKLSIVDINTGGLGRIDAEIKNIGDVNASDVEYSITIDGGLIIFPRGDSGNLGNLAPDESKIITLYIRGIGLGVITPMPKITLTVTCAEGSSEEKSVEAKIIFFFIKIQ